MHREKTEEQRVKGNRWLALVLALAALAVTGCGGNPPKQTGGSGKMVVGKGVAISDVTEFYYTRASSTNPPDYQRYRFYAEDGAYFFYHETRAGRHWPLTERDITVSGTVALSEETWTEFFACLEGGRVQKRRESTESGSDGPWCFLYWSGDRGKYQEFAFASPEAQRSFEALCVRLAADAGN